MKPETVLDAGWGITDVTLEPLGSGHINDTMLVSGPRPVVLQRINEQVFANPALVMRNLVRVQAHLAHSAPGLIPPLIETREGQSSFQDEEGGWWRLWAYLSDGRTLQHTRDPLVCRVAAEAFGRFQHLLRDLPGPPLEPTIPGFLELAGYLERFDQVAGSAREAETAISAACGGVARIDALRGLAAELEKGSTVIHGDCKLNNLLFDRRASAVRAVLDLDTIMIGHWAWDFGDLARSVLTGADDEPSVIRTLFRALVEGFQAGAARRLDARALAVAPVYVAFMLAIRFLTDHLEGDRYFKTSHRGENLERASRQFALIGRLPVADLEADADEVLAR